MTDRGPQGSCFQSSPKLFVQALPYFPLQSCPGLKALAPGSPQAVSPTSGEPVLGAPLTCRRPLVLFAPLYSTLYKAEPTAL